MKVSTQMLAVGAALTIGAAVASAQVRSEQRIPVRKESGGEVALPARVDTVYVRDTVQLAPRVDTVTVTQVRVDTMQVEVLPAFLQRYTTGFYWGLGAGTSLPAANQNDVNEPGFRVEMPFGFDPAGSPLGLRFNVGYAMLPAHSWAASQGLNSGSLVNADVGVKVRLIRRALFERGFQMYLLGGGTWNGYRDIVRFDEQTNTMTYGANTTTDGTTIPAADHSWQSKFGWNAGGGAQVGWGRANLYLESRFSRVGTNGPLSHVPVVLGVTFY